MLSGINIKLNLKYVEVIFLIFIFGFFLTLGANLLDNRLSHEHPYGFFASDAFWHQVVAQWVKDSGNYQTQPPYMSRGFDDVVGFNPPVAYHLAPLMSFASGLEVYDTMSLLVLISVFLGFLIFYLINRKFNKTVAILSVPIFIFVFVRNFTIAITWGQSLFVVGTVFLIAFFWAIGNLELDKSWIFIGILGGALALAHTSELVFGVGFVVVFLLIRFLMAKKINMGEVKKLIYSGILGFVFFVYYFIIFINTWGRDPYKFHVTPTYTGFRVAWLNDFGLLLIILGIGFLLWLLLVKRNFSATLLVPVYMFIVGYTNYIGFDQRAFQTRFFWPVYLSIFFGLVFYYALKITLKKWNIIIPIVISVILLFVLKGMYYVPINSPGIMNPYHWEMLQWLKGNTPEDARNYFFYGDIYNQNALLWNSGRVPFLAHHVEITAKINNGTINRYYFTKLTGASDNNFPYRKGIFEFGYHGDGDEIIGKESYIQRDICNFDYYVFDRVSGQQVFAQYNMIIRNELLQNEFFVEVFANEVSSILKNNNPGADCIEARKIA